MYSYNGNHYEVDFDDIEFIVSAANIAGHLESKKEIVLDSDQQLTEFILNNYKHWCKEECKNVSFEEYITNEMIKEFGVIEHL